MGTTINKELVRNRLSDIILDISWAKFAKRYFDRSPSWIYHKMDGLDGGFSESEKERFKGALMDLSERIRHTAESLR